MRQLLLSFVFIFVTLSIMYLNYFRASSPWTEVEERAWSQPWEMRTFPLTDEEVKELEVFIVLHT